MTALDLTSLRAAAEGATAGSWWAAGAWFDDDGYPMPMVGHGHTGADWIARTARRDGADAAHIAAFDPPTVFALLDRIEAAEAKVARVRKVCAEWDAEPNMPPAAYNVVDDVTAALDGGDS